MTDHFKDEKEPNAKSVRSFKEQILAELEEAHRLRQERESELLASENKVLSDSVPPVEVSEVAEEEPVLVLSEVEDTQHLNQMMEGLELNLDEEAQLSVDSEEVLERVDNVISFTPLEETQSEEELVVDLQETIPLRPLDSQVLSDYDLVEEELESQSMSDSEALSSDKDLSITSVMAGFNKLFDGANKEKGESELVQEDLTASELADRPEVSELSDPSLEETQIFNSKALLEVEETEEDTNAMKRRQRHRTDRIAHKISLALLSLLTLLLLATGFFLYRYVDSGIKPLDPQSTEYVQVEIPSGSGNKLIGKILEDSGVIKSGQIFNYYVKFKNYTDFKSGFYNFQKSMSLDEIAQKLQEGGSDVPERPALGKILIPEGYTLEQIAKAVSLNANTSDKKDKTPFREADFMKLVQDEAFIEKMAAKFPSLLGSLPSADEVKYRLEGYLFPATYSYYEETSLEDIVEQMLAAMDANLSPFYSAIANNGMTVNQVLTLASLVEKEGATDDDRKLIAGVFYNRWNQGMPLQSNIAILYAMGKLGQATTLLEDATIDTGIDSPYNIYVNTGLMPGPVDSPSLSAIKATINPEQSNYLYFVADVTTGAVYYAENYDEHSANVEKYINSHLTKNE